MKKLARFAQNNIIQSIKSFPVTYIAGPRQCGKTTLVQEISSSIHPANYISFDDLQLQNAAKRDPNAFLRSFSGPVVLDEIQLVPELFRPLKILVDEYRNQPDGGKGRFLLTGSASVLALPQLSDALVGRMVLHTLLPFSAAEINQKSAYNFIDQAFSHDEIYTQRPQEDLFSFMARATFPEICTINSQPLKYSWCNSYLTTILQRDVRVLMEIEKLQALPNLLRLCATRTGGLLNESSLSRHTQLNHITLKKYRLLLENLFLTLNIPAWSKNLGKRLIKAPKIYLSDLNLLLHLLNSELHEVAHTNEMLFGQILENFVAIELTKQLTYSQAKANLYHYRTTSGQEIDFILEGPSSRIIGIEIKSKSKLGNKDFQHLETLKQDLGEKFHRGFVFYQGTEIVPFSHALWAVPYSRLWE